MIEDKISSDDYKMKSEQYENLEINLKSKIAVNDVPQNDFKNCLEYDCNILDNLDTFWLKNKLDVKERLQKIIFPKGLRYDSGVFRNGGKSSLFKIIGTLSVPSINMVPPSELESLSTP